MRNWIKRRRNLRRFLGQTRRHPQRVAVRRLLSESLEGRMLLATLTGSDPGANTHDAPVSTNVSATFDEVINTGSATAQNFVVRSTLSSGTRTVTADGMTVTADPSANFFPGEIVNVTATAGLQGAATAVTPRVWQFRTAVNSGSGVFVDSGQVITAPGNRPGFVVLGDADGDGDLDGLEGADLWINDGAGNFADSGQNVGTGQERDFADVDGDGDLDVVSATIWFNNGTGVFTQGSSNLGGGNAIDVGDIDGDGDLDVFKAAPGLYDGAQAWFNDGNGNFTDSGQRMNGSFDQPRGVQLADMDNDGDLDAFVGNWATQDRVFLNDGSGVFTLAFSTADSSSTQDIDIGDFDGDGDNDVFLAHAGGTGVGDMTSRILLNEGNGAEFTQTSAIDPGRTTWAAEVGDMDSDGDLDLVVMNRTGGAGSTIWLNDGNANFGAGNTFTFSGDRRVYGGDIGDVNGDGSLDIWEANVNGATGSRIFFNTVLTPTVSLSVDEASISEGGGVATVTASLSASHTDAVTIDLNLGGSATESSDYVASATQIVIAAGDTSGSITITGTDDSTDEPDETVDVSLGTITNGQGSGQVTITIIDNDEAVVPDVTLAVDNSTIAEASGTAEFTATLSEATSVDVTVDLAVSGTASAADYTISGTQIVIAAGSTSGSVTVTGVDDAENDPDETIVVDISGVTNGNESGTQQATTTIVDDDQPPTVTLSVDNDAIAEAAGVATFTATLSRAIGLPVTVDLDISGTATAGDDYAASGTQIVIAAGSTSGSVTVTAVQDETDEADETVIVDIASVTNGTESGTQTATTTITDDDEPMGFIVSDLSATNSGFVIQFSNDVDTSDLNLYDSSTAGLGAADVVLTGASSGVVSGTLVVGDARTVTFIKTGDALDADTYTVSLRSADDGFNDADGVLLDGDRDGTPGGDYSGSFTIDAPASNAITVSIPDIVRGPGQDINVPGDSTTGIPLTISEGDNVRAIDLRIAYDPALIEITGATVGAEAPAGATVVLNNNTPGLAILVFFSSASLPAGASTFVNLEASVPTANANDIYQSKQVLDLHNITISDGLDNESPVIDNDGVHISEYFADVSGNGRVNAADASLVARFAALIDTGFAASQNADPVVVGDVSGNGRINAADASLVAQVAALIPVDQVPAIPGGVVTTPLTGGPDPKLSLQTGLTAAPGDTITVPVELDSIVDLQSPNRLAGAGLVILYDDAVLTADPVTPGTFITSNSGWTFVENRNTPGRIVVVAFTSSPVAGQFVDTLVNLNFTVNAGAAGGDTVLNLVTGAAGAFTELLDENDNFLELIPAPTDDPTDEVDGIITITGGDPTVSLAVDSAEIAEAAGVATVTATLSAAATTAVTVDLALSGTATDGTDYVASATQIVIAAGDTSGSVTITATDDGDDEGDETVIVDIATVTGANEDGDQQVTTTILDDDGVVLPTVTLGVDSAEIAEAGGVATFTATLSAASTAAVTIDLALSGTATDGTDYAASGTQIVIAAGDTTGSVTVTATDDADDEADETVIVEIATVAGATEDGDQSATTTILDDDVAQVVENRIDIPRDLTAAPGDTIVVPVSISTADLQVGGRLAGVGLALEYDDAVLTATAVAPGNFITSNAGWTIVDNLLTAGRVVVVGFTSTPVGGITSDILVNVTFEVSATAAGGTTALNVVASSGGAFTELLDEDDNALDLAGPVTNGEDPVDGVITITGAAGAIVSLAVDNAEIAEAAGVATVTATLSAAAATEVTIDLGLSGTATDGADYAASATQIVIAAGDTSGSVTVTATDDTDDEADETVIVDITNVTGATEDGDQQVTTTILDDDEPALPIVALSVDNAEIAEAGGVATITATLSAAATTDVTVELGLAGTATDATDYAASGTQIVIAAGDTEGSVTVTAIDDADDEPDETVVVDITSVTGATGSGAVTTTILDDDAPAGATVSLSVDPAEIAEDGGVATVTATLSAAAAAAVTIDLGLSGTATDGTDYTASGTQIVIAAGDTTGSVTVTATDDADDETDETVVVDITNVTGATEDGEQQVTTTILDDDAPAGPTVSLSVDPAEIAEAGGVATVTATLSAAAEAAVTIDLGLSGTATDATDYAASATQIVIAAGDTTGSITVTAIDDADNEADETVIVDITSVAGATEDGDQQVTATILDDDDSVNGPPVLADPGTQTLATTVDSVDVTLVATDPDAADVLTFAAATESGEYYLDQTFGLQLAAGGLFENFSTRLNEKWLLGGNDITWYYVTPDGNFYEWHGGSVLNRTWLAQVNTASYDDPSLIYDAQAGVAVPATVTVAGTTLTINPDTGFVGSFAVAVSVSDGTQSDSQLVLVNVVANEGPVLDDPGNQTLPTTQDTLDVALSATDPMGDTLTFSATAESAEYYLDQTLNLQLGPELFENWSGSQNERWVLGGDGATWYFITPDGNFYRWLGGDRDIAANSQLLASLDPATYADPALLYDAQVGAAAPGTVSVAGSTLTIDPNANFVGFFSVIVTVTDDAGASDSRLIRVDVTAAVVANSVLTLDLHGEGEGSSTATGVGGQEISEIGFAEIDSRTAMPSDESKSARVDAVFSDLDDTADLLNNEIVDDLLS